jgi:hypothetical protein
MDDDTLSIPVPVAIQGDEPLLKFVTALSASIASGAHAHFQPPYEVSVDEATMNGGDWRQNVTVRRGTGVGAEVAVTWSKVTSRVVKLDVRQNSKLDTYVFLGVGLPFILVGACMAYFHVPPLHFLPGRKLATGLGGFIGLVASWPLIAVLQSILGREEKNENERLVATLRSMASDVAARFDG